MKWFKGKVYATTDIETWWNYWKVERYVIHLFVSDCQKNRPIDHETSSSSVNAAIVSINYNIQYSGSHVVMCYWARE